MMSSKAALTAFTLVTVVYLSFHWAEASGSCIDSNGNVCNNQGLCQEGKCVCSGIFIGPLCQDFPEGDCQTKRRCVQCQVFTSGPLSPEECHRQCGEEIIQIVDKIDPDGGYRLCVFRDDEDDCRFTFGISTSSDDPDNPVIAVERVKVCPAGQPSQSDDPASDGHKFRLSLLVLAVSKLVAIMPWI